VNELGVCVAYPNHGHSCWIIAGTFCKGEVQGTFAQKQKSCIVCDIYKLYSSSFGEMQAEFSRAHPVEYDNLESFLEEVEKDYEK